MFQFIENRPMYGFRRLAKAAGTYLRSSIARSGAVSRDAAAAMGIDGYVDVAAPDRIEGWVIARHEPTVRRTVVIVVDGTTFAEIVAGDFRDDLAAASIGLGDGCYAFFYNFTTPVGGGRHRVRVLDAQTGQELRGSPQTITAPAATPYRTLSRPEDTSWTDPYTVYEVWRAYMDAGMPPGELDVARLIRLLRKLAAVLDFEGICEVYDFLERRGLLETISGEDARGAAVLHLAANAQVLCGRVATAVQLCEAGLATFPHSTGLRRVLASVLRERYPERAYAVLEEISTLPCFRQDTACVQMFLDVSGKLHERAFVRAQLISYVSRDTLSELLLQCANLEATPADKVHSVAEHFRSQELAPVSLGAESDSFLGMLQSDVDPTAPQGPLVSVIMTCYNADQYLETAVASLLRQTYSNFELLIVDDHSTDGSFSLAQHFAGQDSRIRVLRTAENGGTYVAKNLALAQAKGAFVTCQDSDDWAHPQKLEAQVCHLLEQPRVVANSSCWVRVDDRGQFYLQSWGRYAYMNPASLMFRREPVLKCIGYFDAVRTGADTEYRQRMACQFGWSSVVELRQVLTLGRMHPNSLMSSGPAAVDSNGYSIVRRQYANDWLDWHTDNLGSGTGLYLPEHQASRKFDAPGKILPKPNELRPQPKRRAFRRLNLVK